jgi:hypothetical protein
MAASATLRNYTTLTDVTGYPVWQPQAACRRPPVHALFTSCDSASDFPQLPTSFVRVSLYVLHRCHKI